MPSSSHSRTPHATAAVEAAGTWLAERAHENLGTEIALRSATGATPGLHVTVARRGGDLTGVSVSASGGPWWLEADGPEATAELVAAVAAAPGGWPAKVRSSGTVKGWLLPLLAARGLRPVREHDLWAMRCSQPPAGAPGQGRWATIADRVALERYQVLYNAERRTAVDPDWDSLLRRPAVAVLDYDGRITAVLKRTADTARYATIGGTWTDPAFRRRGLAQRLATFVVTELLRDRPAVHLIVDDDNAAAIALYRSLGFEDCGRCYMGYLS